MLLAGCCSSSGYKHVSRTQDRHTAAGHGALQPSGLRNLHQYRTSHPYRTNEQTYMPQSPLHKPLTTPKEYHANTPMLQMIQQRNPANVNHRRQNGSKHCFSTRCLKSHLVDTKRSSKERRKTPTHSLYPVEAAGEEKGRNKGDDEAQKWETHPSESSIK